MEDEKKKEDRPDPDTERDGEGMDPMCDQKGAVGIGVPPVGIGPCQGPADGGLLSRFPDETREIEETEWGLEDASEPEIHPLGEDRKENEETETHHASEGPTQHP